MGRTWVWDIAVETGHKRGMGHLDNKKSMCLQRRPRGLEWLCSGSQSVYSENRITLIYDDHVRLPLTRSLTIWASQTGPGTQSCQNGTNDEGLVKHLSTSDGLVADMPMRPPSTNRQQSDVRMS